MGTSALKCCVLCFEIMSAYGKDSKERETGLSKVSNWLTMKENVIFKPTVCYQTDSTQNEPLRWIFCFKNVKNSFVFTLWCHKIQKGQIEAFYQWKKNIIEQICSKLDELCKSTFKMDISHNMLMLWNNVSVWERQ